MIFVWGWRAISLILGTGIFHCPQCQADSEYQHLRPRRWFTVFFLPVIPLNKLDDYVKCQRCKGTFRPVVLEYPTVAQLGYMSALGGRALLTRVLALVGTQGGLDQVAGRLVCETPGVDARSYGPDALHRDVQAFGSAPATTYLAPLREALAVEAREAILARGFTLARAANQAQHGTAAMGELENAAMTLGLTRAQFEGIASGAAGQGYGGQPNQGYPSQDQPNHGYPSQEQPGQGYPSREQDGAGW